MSQLALLNKNGTIADIARARSERDDGMKQALDNAESDNPKWGEKALAYLHNYAEKHERFPGWFVTAAAGLTKAVPVRSGKAWGAIFAKAARLGWIVKNGITQDPNRHANPAPVWKSLLFERSCAHEKAAEKLRAYQVARDNGDEDLASKLWVEYLDLCSRESRAA